MCVCVCVCEEGDSHFRLLDFRGHLCDCVFPREKGNVCLCTCVCVRRCILFQPSSLQRADGTPQETLRQAKGQGHKVSLSLCLSPIRWISPTLNFSGPLSPTQTPPLSIFVSPCLSLFLFVSLSLSLGERKEEEIKTGKTKRLKNGNIKNKKDRITRSRTRFLPEGSAVAE